MTLSRRSFLAAASAAPAAALTPQALSAAGEASTPLPATYRFAVGEATITALLDGFIDVTPEQVDGFDAATASASLSPAQKRLYSAGARIPVNAFLIETGTQKVLVDAGTAGFLGDTLGDMGAALAAIGVRAQDIDAVLLTHIHPDHSGGLIDTSGAAVFANAQLVVGQVEYGFWQDDGIMASVPEGMRGFFQIARATVAPYADRMILHAAEAEVLPGLTSLPLPGHTPGHAGYLLQSGGEQLLFWGDLIHLTALQFDNPGATIAFDTDPKQTAETRIAMLDRAAADDLLVTGAHLDFPGLGTVRRSEGGFRYRPTPWHYGA